MTNLAEPLYEAFDRGTVHGYCHPALLPHLDFFTSHFEDNIKGHVMKVYLERPNWVAAVRLPLNLPFSTVVIKRFGSRSPFHRLLSPFAKSKAIRAFRVAVAVEEAGVNTPQPLLAMEVRRFGFISQCYSITAWLQEASTARELLRSHPPESFRVTALLASLAQATRRLHDAGILHRDLSLGNFLITRLSPGEVYLIDLSRAIAFRSTSGGGLPLLLRLVDLARMNLGSHWPGFFRLYCEGHPDWLRYEKLLYRLVRLRRISISLRKIKKSVS